MKKIYSCTYRSREPIPKEMEKSLLQYIEMEIIDEEGKDYLGHAVLSKEFRYYKIKDENEIFQEPIYLLRLDVLIQLPDKISAEPIPKAKK